MNINAISSFNNVAKAQSFKAASQKIYSDFNEQIPADVPDDAVVDWSTWGDNYPVPITAGQRREAQKEALAKIAAETAAREAYKKIMDETTPSTPPTCFPSTTPSTEPTTVPTTEPTTVPTTEPMLDYNFLFNLTSVTPSEEPSSFPTVEPTTAQTIDSIPDVFFEEEDSSQLEHSQTTSPEKTDTNTKGMKVKDPYKNLHKNLPFAPDMDELANKKYKKPYDELTPKQQQKIRSKAHKELKKTFFLYALQQELKK